MIITLVCDVLGQENNGTTIAAMNLYRSLKSKGHTVRVVCPDEARRGEPDFYIMPKFNFGPLNSYVSKNGVSLAKVDRRILEAAMEGADVVHLLIPFTVSTAARKIALRKGIPITAGFHCQAENITNHIFMMNFGLANFIVYQTFYQKIYRFCAAIHYPTQFICDLFEKTIGQPTNHYVISNGVNRIFCPGESTRPEEYDDKFVIVFTGRYSKEKSHSVLLHAAALSKHRDSLRLIFAGDGPTKEHLIALSKQLGLTLPHMEFYSRTELVNVLRYADLYVHPAEIEIEAIACLEAISCGLVPVISDSSRSATRYFALDEQNLFRCNDPEDLAAKIDYWFENPRKKGQRQKEYLGFARQFDFDLCMDRMEQMLLDAADNQKNA